MADSPNTRALSKSRTAKDPAKKYAHRLSPQHLHAMQTVADAHKMIKVVEKQLRILDDAERQAHALIGHTALYRDMVQSKQFARQMMVVRATLGFLEGIDNAVRLGSSTH